MADKLGVTSTYLSLIELGEKIPSERVVDKIAEVYGLSKTGHAELRCVAFVNFGKYIMRPTNSLDAKVVDLMTRRINFGTLSTKDSALILNILRGKSDDDESE